MRNFKKHSEFGCGTKSRQSGHSSTLYNRSFTVIRKYSNYPVNTVFLIWLHTGQIGLDIRGVWFEPAKSSEPGINDTLEQAFQFEMGWLTEPILSSGDYSTVLKQRVGNKLPNFSANQTSLLKGNCNCKCSLKPV